ncbi:MAG: hypothetical protein KBD37_02160 [Burkholderiales bacterium]|nr:hypothetical protein [Burkholderiales bacterium]
METLLGNNSLSAPDKLNIVPIYSDIDIGEITSYINNNAPLDNSTPDSILNNYTDDD